MANSIKNRKYFWVIPLLIVLIILFVIFKPKNLSEKTVNSNQPASHVSVIRIAVPDLSSSDRHSSGTALIDNIYLNKLLEKEFDKDQIKIEWQFFKGAGPAINEALANQQLDFAFLGDLAAIIGKANQIDTRLLVATVRQSNGYLAVQPNQGYDNLEKLKGKRIAVWQGTASQLSFNRFIAQYGLSEKDFRIVNLDPPAMNAALVAKQIDAGWGSLGLLALQQKGIVEIPLSSKQGNGQAGTTEAGLVGRSAFIQQSPELTQRLVNTVLKSAHWVAQPENREAAIELVANNANYPVALYALGFKDQDFKVVHSPLLDQAYIDHYRQGVDSALKAQLIRQTFDVDQWVDHQFVDQGIKQLGYENVW
ncbi:ABC transporter substrate-binding protein [Acinetobacter populi]|uniref:Sulfate ester-binding protein n=1 Tax=Acinetobacter populi TaxID=1582270 RepID=A0A1Z9YVD4_9GAMM|nr:ABC transporter substrate-binding protein [Acinetobacter populi]OUY06155.1 sulfate ester-binding protein [Acinetobacter populi]